MKLDRIELRFREFHANNPHIYRELVTMARAWKQSGGNRIGIATLVETLRWQSRIQTKSENYKISNDYRALYARLIMEQEPDLVGIFIIKERTTKLN